MDSGFISGGSSERPSPNLPKSKNSPVILPHKRVLNFLSYKQYKTKQIQLQIVWNIWNLIQNEVMKFLSSIT
jgi:hypothetical protein